MKNTTQTKTFTFLLFQAGQEKYGVCVNNVLSILENPVITSIPEVPDIFEGITDHYGTALPVINLHRKFNSSLQTTGNNRCIIVLLAGPKEAQQKIGLHVDSVEDVVSYGDEDIQLFPETGDMPIPEYLSGIVKNGEKYTMILNLQNLLKTKELHLIQNTKQLKLQEDFV